MRIFVALALLVALVAAELDDNDARLQFHSFMRKYEKEYRDGADEYNHRFGIFKRNLEHVRSLNNPSLGVTKFMDLTPEEFQNIYLAKNMVADEDVSSWPMAELPSQDDLDVVPNNFDWRDNGAVTAVKNQGQCGSCWSFSTTGNVEARWFLAGHPLIPLSEQNLVDCDTLDHGCNGGIMYQAYSYVIANGLNTEKCYPYLARQQGSCYRDAGCATAQVRSWEWVAQNEEVIKWYIYQNSPVSCAANAGPMQYYVGGVLDTYCPGGSTDIDHALLIVGYGVDQTTSKPYWIIKNSWGDDYGESGYLRLVRGSGACGIEKYVMSVIV